MKIDFFNAETKPGHSLLKILNFTENYFAFEFCCVFSRIMLIADRIVRGRRNKGAVLTHPNFSCNSNNHTLL